MRTTAIAAACAALLGVTAAPAATVTTAGGDKVEIEVSVKARLVTDDTAFTQGKHGYYVFVASALEDGSIEVEAIENAVECTNVRPKFGRTVPTDGGGFTKLAYATYYGPYATAKDARDVKVAVAPCVPDAYVRAGVIQRF